jgi:hypothetical protein
MNDAEYAKFLPAYVANKGKLGKAVHPYALMRLHELYPYARVTVRQIATPIELPFGSHRMDASSYYAHPEHETVVYIDPPGDRSGDVVEGVAICHPLDNYDRRKGIHLAFTRALDEARRMYDPPAWAAAKLANLKKVRK